MNKKKNVIVTGASKGIGKAIAIKLAKENYNVHIFGRDLKRLKTLKNTLSKIGSETDYYSGDVADEKFVNKSVSELIKKYKKIEFFKKCNSGIIYQ